MHKLLLLLSIFILTMAVVEAKSYKYFSSKTGKEIKLKNLINELDNADVIFYGEFHDNPTIHAMEYDFTVKFYKKYRNVCISMEMFERDVQPVMDEYLSSSISEEQFIAGSRPWPNYKEDYAPIVNFAKKKNLDVVAANVPRRYAAGINKQGIEFYDSIPESEKEFVAKELKVLDDEYKARFIEIMKSNMSTAMHTQSTPSFDNIYAAQCLKDDTMAESLADYIMNNPGKKVVHFNGDFHSNSHLGTAQRLKILLPNLNIVVISPQLVNEEEVNIESRLIAGDYIIMVPVVK